MSVKKKQRKTNMSHFDTACSIIWNNEESPSNVELIEANLRPCVLITAEHQQIPEDHTIEYLEMDDIFYGR